MENFIETPTVKEFCEITQLMYKKGWDERNGGNVSWILDEDKVRPYLNNHSENVRKVELPFTVKELANRYLLVTGTGKYFKNIINDPQDAIGLIQIADDGKSYEILWGFVNGAVATSELPTHLMNHIQRLEVDKEHRVIMHCHATHTIAMTFSHELDEKLFTKTLWKMCTECLVVFPDGIGIIPWVVPGTEAIGKLTAEKMKNQRSVIWPFHGVFGAGQDLDETFGLIETIEKSAEVYTYVKSQGGIKQDISDENLLKLAKGFNVEPKHGYLEVGE
ncbi:rhamnulose-1-phosphate aldolase [Mammaliicoccus lentus]|uniref:rhamnulose-1-phosphate aldolase n=1 Tax=Mammaliicoccus lentus TaxID=42858 RepID=UPI002647C83D|nr:rhamnulose-1-phosphate aldolase [Mammaliicoccus lentus]